MVMQKAKVTLIPIPMLAVTVVVITKETGEGQMTLWLVSQDPEITLIKLQSPLRSLILRA